MNKKENRGITLVALVITIIVLIILAGVSINAVLNGGVIGNAKNARDQYDTAKQEEQTTLSQLEIEQIEIEFLKKGIPYKYKNGYITGVNVGTTAQEMLNDFPKDEGYAIFSKEDTDGTNEITDEDILGTRMVLKKGTATIGKILIYGDVDGDTSITATDSSYVNAYAEGSDDENWEVLAMDVNHDGLINWIDVKIIYIISTNLNSEDINQDVYAVEANRESKAEIIGRYVNSIKDEELKEKFTENSGMYTFTGVTNGTTVDTLMDAYEWPEGTRMLSGPGGTDVTDSTTAIALGYTIAIMEKWNEYDLKLDIAYILALE